MHLDYTIHLWPMIGYISSFAGAATFLVKVYRLIKRGVNSAEVLLGQHNEMYDWYSEHVKPHQKPNGSALGRVNDRI